MAQDRHRGQGHDLVENKLETEIIGDGTTTSSSGAGSSSPTPTTSCRCYLCNRSCTKDGTRSTPACPTRSTATRRTTSCTSSRARTTDPAKPDRDRQADAEDALRRRAVRRDRTTTTTSRPTAATGAPTSRPQPTPGGVLSSSTAPTPTKPAADSAPGRRAKLYASSTPVGASERLADRQAASGGAAGAVVGWIACCGARGVGRARASGGRPARTTVVACSVSDVEPPPFRIQPAGGEGRDAPAAASGVYVAAKAAVEPRHADLRPGLQLLPVPGAARRPGQGAHPRPHVRPRRSSRCRHAARPRPAAVAPVPHLHREPVLRADLGVSFSSRQPVTTSSATGSGRRSCWSGSARSCRPSSASGSASRPAGARGAVRPDLHRRHAHALRDAGVLARHDPDPGRSRPGSARSPGSSRPAG